MMRHCTSKIWQSLCGPPFGRLGEACHNFTTRRLLTEKWQLTQPQLAWHICRFSTSDGCTARKYKICLQTARPGHGLCRWTSKDDNAWQKDVMLRAPHQTIVVL